MSTTGNDVFSITMDLIDERLDNGTLSNADTISYRVKAPGLLTILQNEIMKIGDLYKTFEISNKPVTNMFGYTNGFDIQAYEGTSKTFECNSGGAKAYYFEVDGEGTVYIEDWTGAWNTLATITVPDTVTSFTAYKGVVTPTAGATKSRIRFEGSYYYRTVNRALFSIPFSASRIPDYRPWIAATMPADFKSVDQIVEEFPEQQYEKSSTYKWEGRNKLYYNFYYDGNIRIVYKPIPATIAALTQTLEVDDITATTVLPYGLAALLLLDENPSSANFFQQKFEQLKAESMLKQPMTESAILDLYGGVN